MRKTTSQEPPPAPKAMRVAFFPFRPDMIRLQKFADIYAERAGLVHVHPTVRDVFHFILDCAETGLTSNGHSHTPQEVAPEPEPPPAPEPVAKKHKKK